MARIGRGATVRGCVSLILAGTALLALFMSSGPWIITVAMNDLAMQGSAAIGIGVFTPWLASGSFHAIALVCVGAATTGILGDWTHEYLSRKGR
jgi:DHA2 family metal-tetracycline-proton antiporter-like MFS transporter